MRSSEFLVCLVKIYLGSVINIIEREDETFYQSSGMLKPANKEILIMLCFRGSLAY